MMRSGRVLLCLLLVAPATPGCVRASAKAVTASPPLEMPPAPPRLVETVDATPQQPVTLIEEPPRQPIRTAPARPAPRAEAAPPRPEAPRADAVPPEPPRPLEEPAKPPTLQTTPAGAEGEVERTIRAILTRANGDLNRVDYRGLNADARSQYDTAKRFIQQADEALRPPRNLVFARNLADKAAALAAQLAGR